MDLVVVDCENISYDTIKKLFSIKKYRHITLIVGAGQKLEDYIKFGMSKMIKCSSIGKNAADFVAIAVVTQMAAKGTYKKICIVSDDTGFDAAVKYLNEEGFNVIRLTTKGVNKRFRASASTKTCVSGVNMYNLAPFCGFIANHLPSGVGIQRFTDTCRKNNKKKADEYIEKLQSLGLITISKNKKQVYFSKKKLGNIAHTYTNLEV